MNVRQDQIVPGRTDALARAAYNWHVDNCWSCQNARWCPRRRLLWERVLTFKPRRTP